MRLQVVLRVPIVPSSLSIIRSVVGSVAIRADLTYEQIDDLRTAVGEAASRIMLVGEHDPSDRLSVSLGSSATDVEVELLAPGASTEPLLPAGSLSSMIVNGLVDEVDARSDESGSAIRLVKHRVAPR